MQRNIPPALSDFSGAHTCPLSRTERMGLLIMANYQTCYVWE